MRNVKLFLFLCAVLGAAVFLAGFSFQGKTDSLPEGKALYKKHCQNCHRKKGQGFLKSYPPLTDTAWVGNDTLMVRNIVKGIRGPITVNGKEYNKEMAPITGLKNEEVAAIINYVRIEIAKIDLRITPEKVAALRNL